MKMMSLKIINIPETCPNGVQALKIVTLNIANGMYGLTGPNGAHKSTLVRIQHTLREPHLSPPLPANSPHAAGRIHFFSGGSASQAPKVIDVIREKDEIRKAQP